MTTESVLNKSDNKNSMVQQVKNNRGNLTRLFWDNPLDLFMESNDSDLPGEEIFQIIPTINVKETKEYYSIHVVVPGVQKEDFKVELEGNYLTVSCEKETKNEKESGYSYASFSRSFTLPEDADLDYISAKYEDGLLVLRINKKQQTTKRKDKKANAEYIQ